MIYEHIQTFLQIDMKKTASQFTVNTLIIQRHVTSLLYIIYPKSVVKLLI